MANTYFQFKQFTVNQDHCGMKVTTDACLFGAWVANLLYDNKNHFEPEFNVLDIGTGTGLLALMLAQINPNISIDAVEIDGMAALQAIENFKNSPFNQQLKIYQEDIKEFNPSMSRGYPFIITNPPFFDDDLKSPLHNRNLAMHSVALSLEELVYEIKRLLNNEGRFAILLPYHRTEYFIGLALKEGFKLLESLFVKQTMKHSYFRSMLLFIKEDNKIDTINLNNVAHKNELKIKVGIEYSDSFKELLSPYYLKL